MTISYPSFLKLFVSITFIAVIRLSSPEILFSQSNNITDSLQSVLNKAGRKAKIMNEIAEEFLQINPNISLKKSIDALETAKNEKNEFEEVNALFNIASAHISLCNYDTAKIYSRKSYELCQKMNDTLGISDMNTSLPIWLFYRVIWENHFHI